MRPPYEITPKILQLIVLISEKIGAVNANLMDKPSPQLRKRNKIRTIHNSLKIEGNSLSEEQITALLDNKRVVGPAKDINEVLNALKVYDNIKNYNPFSEKSFLSAHKDMMRELIKGAGKYRTQGVGIVKGDKVEHLTPPYSNVPHLMKNLFIYLKDKKELNLIKSCVFHYEMEFIHPFLDGNGRMGRLWQNLILINEYPLFEFISLESIISHSQHDYYKSLADSDQSGKSTKFIEYMLNVINESLKEVLNFNSRKLNQQDRIEYFIALEKNTFTRKDYMNVFKTISSATASRDLKKGIELKVLEKHGFKNQATYIIIRKILVDDKIK